MAQLSDFLPVNDDHAVVSVKFTIQLDEFIEPQTIEAAQARGSWLKELPAVTALPLVKIPYGSSHLDTPATQFAIVRPDGTPLWALRFNGYQVEVICTAYTRWDPTWKAAEKYLKDAWEIIVNEQQNANIVNVQLEVDDAFTCAEENYKITNLFADSPYFRATGIFERGIWQSRSGWMREIEGAQLFHTLTVQSHAGFEDYKFVAPYRFTVKHSQTVVSFSEGGVLADGDIGRISRQIPVMHRANKDILNEMLAPLQASRIGLTS